MKSASNIVYHILFLFPIDRNAGESNSGGIGTPSLLQHFFEALGYSSSKIREEILGLSHPFSVLGSGQGKLVTD